MTERPYSKRELDLKFTSIVDKNDAWSATILKAIEEGHRAHADTMRDMREHEIKPILSQTTITNGRVGKLEQRADRNDRWRSWLTGAAFVLVPVFMAVSGWLIMQQLSVHRQVDAAVEARFEEWSYYELNEN